MELTFKTNQTPLRLKLLTLSEPKMRPSQGRKSIDFALTKPLIRMPGENVVKPMVLSTNLLHPTHQLKMG